LRNKIAKTIKKFVVMYAERESFKSDTEKQSWIKKQYKTLKRDYVVLSSSEKRVKVEAVRAELAAQ
jgi:hypothetical protein